MPRIGHVHVTVDDLPWRWADASGEQLILTGLFPGPHKVLIELVSVNHQIVDDATVSFVVPAPTIPAGRAKLEVEVERYSISMLEERHRNLELAEFADVDALSRRRQAPADR